MTLKSETKILVTHPLPGEGIKKICDEFDTEILNETPSREKLLDAISGKDAVICTLNEKMDAEVLNKNPNLKLISNVAVGYNNIDVSLTLKKNIQVTHTPNVLTDATAEFTIGLILALLRRIPEGDRICRKSEFQGWTPTYFLGTQLTGAKLGIIGAGRIGKRVAELAKAFKMEILMTPEDSLEKILKNADVVTLHIPLKEDTFHLIDSQALKLMKKSAFLINTSRGEVVDEGALAKALINGEIKGAALDVFEDEPKINPQLMDLEQVLLTPHIGSATKDTRANMANLACEAVHNFFNGTKPKNLIPEWNRV